MGAHENCFPRFARRSTSSSNIGISTRKRGSSRDQLSTVKRSATTPVADLDLDSSDENLGAIALNGVCLSCFPFVNILSI